MILSLDFTCRNQLQQTLHVCRFWQVCVSCNLLSLVISLFRFFDLWYNLRLGSVSNNYSANIQGNSNKFEIFVPFRNLFKNIGNDESKKELLNLRYLTLKKTLLQFCTDISYQINIYKVCKKLHFLSFFFFFCFIKAQNTHKQIKSVITKMLILGGTDLISRVYSKAHILDCFTVFYKKEY